MTLKLNIEKKELGLVNRQYNQYTVDIELYTWNLYSFINQSPQNIQLK